MKIKNSAVKQQSKVIFAFCLALFICSGLKIKAQELEIQNLIKEVSVDSQKGAIFNYTYQMRFSFERHKFGGRKLSRVYEAVLPSHFTLSRTYAHPLLLVEDSERTITSQDIKFSREALVKEIERAESEEVDKPAEPGKLSDDGGYWTIAYTSSSQKIGVDVLQLLKNSRLSNFQRKTVNGASIVSLDFAPDPSAKYDKPLAYLSKLEGQIWIDESAKRVIRVEGFAAGTAAEQKTKTEAERQKEAIFLFQQVKVSEGFWFPKTVRLNFAKHPELFDVVELEFAFTDYKKWGIDVQYQNNKTNEKTEEKPSAATPLPPGGNL